MAEQADARDLKSRDMKISYGFETRLRHQKYRSLEREVGILCWMTIGFEAQKLGGNFGKFCAAILAETPSPAPKILISRKRGRFFSCWKAIGFVIYKC